MALEKILIFGLLGSHIFWCSFGKLEEPTVLENLSKDDFEEEVLKSDGIWIVEFCNPKDKKCTKIIPELEQAAVALEGIVNVGLVDVTKNEDFAHHYDANEAPTLLIFGADKTKPYMFREKITARSLADAAIEEFKDLVKAREGKESNPKKDVAKLTGENFFDRVLSSKSIWFVKYYDPNCPHSRSFAPEYAKAASALKGVANFGAVNMDVEIYEDMGEPYKIERIPTIKIFGTSKKVPSEFEGQRTSADLIKRALEELQAVIGWRLAGEKEEMPERKVVLEDDDEKEEENVDKKEEETEKEKKETKEKKEEKEEPSKKDPSKKGAKESKDNKDEL